MSYSSQTTHLSKEMTAPLLSKLIASQDPTGVQGSLVSDAASLLYLISISRLCLTVSCRSTWLCTASATSCFPTTRGSSLLDTSRGLQVMRTWRMSAPQCHLKQSSDLHQCKQSLINSDDGWWRCHAANRKTPYVSLLKGTIN